MLQVPAQALLARVYASRVGDIVLQPHRDSPGVCRLFHQRVRGAVQLTVLVQFQRIQRSVIGALVSRTHDRQRTHIDQGFHLEQALLHAQVLRQQLARARS